MPPRLAELQQNRPDPTLRDIKLERKTVRYLCKDEVFEFYVTYSEEEVAKLTAGGHAAFTAEEFGDFMAWAARARAAGTPYTMKDLIRWSRIRLEGHELGLAYVGSYTKPDKPEIQQPMFGVAIDPPDGWKQGGIDACVKCGSGTVWKDNEGTPRHLGH